MICVFITSLSLIFSMHFYIDCAEKIPLVFNRYIKVVHLPWLFHYPLSWWWQLLLIIKKRFIS